MHNVHVSGWSTGLFLCTLEDTPDVDVEGIGAAAAEEVVGEKDVGGAVGGVGSGVDEGTDYYNHHHHHHHLD